MNDVMTDNIRCPFTEYTISHFLSISSFVESCRLVKLVQFYQKRKKIS
jgi:hypothetical protein